MKKPINTPATVAVTAKPKPKYSEGELPPHQVEMRLVASTRVELLSIMATTQVLMGDKIKMSFSRHLPCQRGWQVYATIQMEYDNDIYWD